VNLTDFPRPRQDSGRGVHWTGDVYANIRDWLYWRDQLQQVNIRWVKMLDDGGGSGLPLARRLVDIGIMPVVRLYPGPGQNPGNIGSRGAEAVRAYLDIGACYFETNNEPDLALEWKGSRLPDDWLDQVVYHWIIDADIILGEGGYPAVPAFGVGTLRDPYQAIVDAGRGDILDGGAWAALHNYCLARPLAYPNDSVNTLGTPITKAEWEDAGGLWAWEMGVDAVNEARRELANPSGANIMTDATCFRAYEQLNAYIVNACGHSIPIMMTEGGYNVGQRAGTTFGDDPRYAKPTPQRCSELNRDMFRFVAGETTILGQHVPGYLFAVMPWLIAAERMNWYAPPAENQGPWYTHKYDTEWGLDGELPLVQMLRDEPGTVRADGPTPDAWTVTRASDCLGDAWDNRLDYIGVRYDPVWGEYAGYWRLVCAEWRDHDEAHGLPAIFVKALSEDGQPIESATFRVTIGGEASISIPTKGPMDRYWGNSPMYGSLGTYDVEMSGPSDAVLGMGAGVEHPPEHPWAATQFWLTFQWTKADTVNPDSEPPDEPPVTVPDDVTAAVMDALACVHNVRQQLLGIAEQLVE